MSKLQKMIDGEADALGVRARKAAPLRQAMSSPSNKMLPAVGSTNFTIARPRVVLPQPLSPTKPSVSPGRMEKLTSLTLSSTV